MNLVSHNIEEFFKKNHSGKLVYLQPGDKYQYQDFWETDVGVHVVSLTELHAMRYKGAWPGAVVTESMMQYGPRRYVGSD